MLYLDTHSPTTLPYTQTDKYDAGNEKEAKKAAERELDPNRAPKPPPAPSKTTNAGPAATSRSVLTSTADTLKVRWTNMLH